jgi:hypothetical protein
MGISMFWKLRSPLMAEDFEKVAGRDRIVDINVDNWEVFRRIQAGHDVAIATVDEAVYLGKVTGVEHHDPSNLVTVTITEKLE